MAILNKQQQDVKKLLDEKIMDLALKKGLTYVQAKKMLEAGQRALSDFKIR